MKYTWTMLPNGLAVATLNLWDGTKWQALPLPQMRGFSPIPKLFGPPVVHMTQLHDEITFDLGRPRLAAYDLAMAEPCAN